VTILLLSGSTRERSTNTAALRTAHNLALEGVTTRIYGGLVDLPAFIPDVDDQRAPVEIQRLRRELAQADALLISTPEYAGTLPGSLKNLLDWTIPTGDLYEKPVAWINVAAPGRGSGVIDTLRLVLNFATAEIITPACRRAHVGREMVGADGLIAAAEIRAVLRETLESIAAHLRVREEPRSP